jgi:hypothetical protein
MEYNTTEYIHYITISYDRLQIILFSISLNTFHGGN